MVTYISLLIMRPIRAQIISGALCLLSLASHRLGSSSYPEPADDYWQYFSGHLLMVNEGIRPLSALLRGST